MHITNEFGQPVGPALPDWQPPPPPPRQPMAGRFCRLEPLLPERHAADLHAANELDADASSWTYLPYGPFTELAAYRDWMQQACTGGRSPVFCHR